MKPRHPWLAGSPSALLVVAGVWFAACGDDGEDPGVSQNDAAVLADAGGPISGPVAAVGAGGGTQGGGTQGGGTQGGGTQGGGTQGGGTQGGGMGMRDSSVPNPTRDSGTPAPVDSGMAPVGDGGPDMFAEVRQVCVDTINMYRMTMNLPPLARANAMQESCSDEGAKYDGDLNRGKTSITGHQSTRNRSAACQRVGFSSQNTCPNWGVGPRTGNATLADAIKRCLAQMWAEGMPPIPVADCVKDQAAGGCFLTHGHWINMTSTSSKGVACGFYNVEGGTYWMNQDFTR